MANMNNNTTKVYYALDEQMMAYHDKNDTRGQAEEIAHDLIKYADLPIIIRSRALCVLASSDEGDYVYYAEQRVHFAKLGLAATQEDGGDDTDGKLILEGCEEGLAAAKEAKAAADDDAKAATTASTGSGDVEVEQDGEQDGEEDDEEEEEEEEDKGIVEIRGAQYEDEEDTDDEDEGEVVWHADWDDERKAEAWAAQDRLAVAAAGEGDATVTSALSQQTDEDDEGDDDETVVVIRDAQWEDGEDLHNEDEE
ncbi:hypothetical protein Q7P35_010901 [Cladosporium inversicolor]